MQTTGQGASETTTHGGGDPDAMSPAELAYFNSGGKDTSGLESDWSDPGPASPQSAQAEASGQQQSDGSAPDAGADDEDVDGEIVIDSAGRAKDKTTGRFVPHKAFHAVREKYKATRDELQQTREKFARVDERLSVINGLLEQQAGGTQGQQQQQSAADEPAPDPEKDLFGYVRWQHKVIEDLKSKMAESERSSSERSAEVSFRQQYVSDATAFLEKQSDFPDAYQYLVKARDAELQALGIADPAARKAQIAKDERELAQTAWQQKLSPSQVLYNFAKARGYVQAQQKTDTTKSPDDAVRRIEQIANGQKAAGNPLSSAGGSSGEGLTKEALADMSEAEYEALVSKLSAAQLKKLLGG